MEEGNSFTSLQTFTEESTPGGNSLILEHSNGSQGLKRCFECLRSQSTLLILIGFLASICASLVLTVLLKQCRECPEDWRHAGDQCYYFSSDKLDLLKCRDSCEKMGSHLTTLSTMEQHDALEKEARRISGSDYHFWIS